MIWAATGQVAPLWAGLRGAAQAGSLILMG